jgi:hypothetical protein
MHLLKRFLAITAGIMAFVAVMLLTGPATDVMSHAFFKTTSFPDGQPPDRFIVALRDTAKPAAEEAMSRASWKQVATLRATGRKFTFLVSGAGGIIPSERDFYSYTVIEDRKISQIIEVQFINSHRSWSRYEAFEDRIVPISYRTDGSLLSLIPIFGLLFAGIFIGRRVTKWARQKLEVAAPANSRMP